MLALTPAHVALEDGTYTAIGRKIRPSPLRCFLSPILFIYLFYIV